MFKKIFNNKYFIAALSIVTVTLLATLGWVLLTGTDAYFSDNTVGDSKANSGRVEIAINETNMEAFADTEDEVIPLDSGATVDFGFEVKNTAGLAVDANTKLIISSSDALDWEGVSSTFLIYDKKDVTFTNGVYVPNEGAQPIGEREVSNTGIVVTFPRETLSGSKDTEERRIEWINSEGEVISSSEYHKLTTSERDNYSECPDVKPYDLVFFMGGDQNGNTNLQFVIETTAYKHNNIFGWSDTETYGPKYGQVISDPYRGILESGEDFNAHMKELSSGVDLQGSTITFTSMEVPEGVETVDVSYSQNRNILAWIQPKTGLFAMLADAEPEEVNIVVSPVGMGKIRTNWDCSYMFSDMKAKIEYDTENLIFDSSLTENMSHMFDGYTGYKVDLSSWTTENVTDMSYLFSDTTEYGGPTGDWKDQQVISSLGSIVFGDNFTTDKVTNMSHMFNNYTYGNIAEVVKEFNTENVTDMSYMFAGTSRSSGTVNYDDHTGLYGDLDLSGWEVSKVTNMSHMFDGAFRLSSINITGWDTSKVEDMSWMFANMAIQRIGTSGIKALDTTTLNTSACKDMSYMFYDTCTLNELDVSGFDTKNVENMAGMFGNINKKPSRYSDSGPTTLSISGFNTDKVKDMSYMFIGDYRLATIDVSGFNTENVENMAHMFDGCSKITTLAVNNFNTAKVQDMSYMFNGAIALKTLSTTNFNTSSVKDMNNMFNGCKVLTAIDVSGWDTVNVENMNSMFYGCAALTTLNTENWTTSKVVDMASMFNGCSKLTTIGNNKFDTGNVTDMSYMFKGCSSLKALDMTTWSTSKVITTAYMFDACTSLQTITLPDLNTETIQNMSYMFRNCGVKSLSVNNWETENVGNMAYMFYQCKGLTELDLSNWDVAGIDNMAYMFAECSNLASIDLSNWDTSNVTDMQYMFYNCTKLLTLDIDHFNVQKVQSMRYMFEGCKALRLIDLSGWKLYDKVNVERMFYYLENLETIYAGDWTQYNPTGGSPLYYTQSLTGDDAVYDEKNYGVSMMQPTTGYFSTKPEYTANMLIEGPYLNQIIPSNVTAVVFTDSVSGTDLIDLSAAGDGSVVGWLNGTTYYIASRDGGKIVATTCSSMFNGKKSLKTVDFTNLDTSKSKTMTKMFYQCSALTDANTELLDMRSCDSTYYMFYQCTSLTEIDVTGWDMSEAKSLKYIFYGCSKVTSFPGIIEWSLDECWNIYAVFMNCSALTELDLHAWKMPSAVNTTNLFSGCSNLIRLDLSGWELPSTLANTANMFSNCSKLCYIYAKDWTDMISAPSSSSGMFDKCSSLEGNTVFNSSKTTWTMANAAGYFTNKVSKPNAIVRGNAFGYSVPSGTTAVIFNSTLTAPANAIDVSHMSDGSVLGWLDNKTFYVTSATNEQLELSNSCYRMFANAPTSITKIDFGDVNTDAVKNMAYMFHNKSNLVDLNMDVFNTENVKDMSYMFYGCSKLAELNINHFDVGNVENMTYMLYNCQALEELDLSDWEVSSLTNSSYMFSGCKKLATIYAEDWTAMATPSSNSGMFNSCTELVGAAVFYSGNTGWAYATPTTGYFTKPVELVTKMLVDGPTLNSLIPETATQVLFTGVVMSEETTDLSALGDGSVVGCMVGDVYYISTLDMTNVIAHPNSRNMFYNKTNIDTIDFTFLDTSKVQNMAYMFYNCTALKDVEFDAIDTSNVVSMAYMFYNCRLLGTSESEYTQLEISQWNTAKVQDMKYMFYNCVGLTDLDLSGWNVPSMVDASYMFRACEKLTTIYAGDWTSASTPKASTNMFTNCSKLVGAISYSSSKSTWTYANPTTGYFTTK